MAAISIAFHIRLRRDLENCLYIDGWCAPGVHTGTRAHRRFWQDLIKHGEISCKYGEMTLALSMVKF